MSESSLSKSTEGAPATCKAAPVKRTPLTSHIFRWVLAAVTIAAVSAGAIPICRAVWPGFLGLRNLGIEASLALFTFALVAVSWMQWDKLREHSEHLEALAEQLRDAASHAATLATAAEHTMSSQQRPWLAFSDAAFEAPRAGEPYRVSIKITNLGGTPAQLVSLRGLIKCHAAAPQPSELDTQESEQASGILVPQQHMTLTREGDGVAVRVDVEGLTPPRRDMRLCFLISMTYRDLVKGCPHRTAYACEWDQMGTRMLPQPQYHTAD